MGKDYKATIFFYTGLWLAGNLFRRPRRFQKPPRSSEVSKTSGVLIGPLAIPKKIGRRVVLAAPRRDYI